MKLSIFGLGYVGCVTAVCLADLGHDVVGVDIKKEKVEDLKKGKPPIYEKGLEGILNKPDVKERLMFTTKAEVAIRDTDISFICVGTPTLPSGKIDIRNVENVANEIGRELKNKDNYHLIVIRSTIFPGLIHSNIIPILEKASEKKAFTDFGICMHPEFLREGSAIDDFMNPHKIIIGGDDKKSIEILKKLYIKSNIFSEDIIYTMPIKQAQFVKYVDNIFHALKVVFANEVGTLAKDVGIDPKRVMEIFVKDRKLNLSPYYLRPGFAYGGSCLPKDLRAFVYYARSNGYEIPLIESVEKSNERHIERAAELIQNQGKHKIGFLGITFKSGTDDIRGNPIFPLIGRLMEKGYEVLLFDEKIPLESIERMIPGYAKFFVMDGEEFLDSVELIVIGNNLKESRIIERAIKKNIPIIDLQGAISNSLNYDNIITLC